MIASFLILIGYAIYGMQLRGGMPIQPGPGAICTMEAKQCPDGSYVGRQGPNCEFAACPGSKPPVGGGACVIGGCSGQICQDANEEPAVTDCMYRPEYACYKQAKCERQVTGECGWTLTASARLCLQNPPVLR